MPKQPTELGSRLLDNRKTADRCSSFLFHLLSSGKNWKDHIALPFREELNSLFTPSTPSLLSLPSPEHLGSSSFSKPTNLLPRAQASLEAWSDLKRCPKILRPKASPSSFQEGVTPRDSRSFQNTQRLILLTRIFTKSAPQEFARIRAKEQSWDSLLIHSLADSPFSIISNPGTMPPGLRRDLGVRVEKAGRGVCAAGEICRVA